VKAILVVGCGVFGLLIGSFLNVVIYRVPQGTSIVAPGSACPGCGTAIAWYDNVPVLSWIVLRGRCRSCRTGISARYAIVEILTALLFAATAARFGANWVLPALLVFTAGLIALAFTDLDHHLLPVKIVYPVLLMVGALLVAASYATHDWHRLVVAAASGLVWFLVFFALNAVSPRFLGFGDVRLAFVLGLALGWLGVGYVLVGFYAANVVGAVVGLSLIGTKRIGRSTPIPYGVFLAIGAFVALFAGAPLISYVRGL
jgi:leader peptidase (prepilin peptidase)/N-methyltransferase